jgi:hypothetical protein
MGRALIRLAMRQGIQVFGVMPLSTSCASSERMKLQGAHHHVLQSQVELGSLNLGQKRELTCSNRFGEFEFESPAKELRIEAVKYRETGEAFSLPRAICN